jgi:hypothetical protein
MAAVHEVIWFLIHFAIAVVFRVLYYGTFDYDGALMSAVIGSILESLFIRFMKMKTE